MSAKRARKPLAEISGNAAKKQKCSTGSTSTASPETFSPLHHCKPKHIAEARVPDGTALEPLAFFSLYWDDGTLPFTTVPLLRQLRSKLIGGCGTTRINSSEQPIALKSDVKQAWNTIDWIVVKPPATADTHCSDSTVLCIRWEDNNIVRFLTTVHPWNEVTLSERRKPRTTSSNAANVRRVFGTSERKSLFIPTVVDDYNRHMNGVDLADQRRSTYTTHQRTRRNWPCLFFFLLDITLVNISTPSYRTSPQPTVRYYYTSLFRRSISSHLGESAPCDADA